MSTIRKLWLRLLPKIDSMKLAFISSDSIRLIWIVTPLARTIL